MKEEVYQEGYLSEFTRYVRGEMAKREEISFRRKLLTDPPTKGFVESFYEISPGKAPDDEVIHGKNLRRSVKPGKGIIYYTIGASVATVIVGSSVFLILEATQPDDWQLNGITTPEPITVTDSEQITGFFVADSIDVRDTSELKAEQEITNVITDTFISALTEKPAIDGNNEVSLITGRKDSTLYIAGDKISALTSISGIREIPGLSVRGKILSSESNLPVVGVRVFVKGTNSGAITDAGGNFILTLPDEKNRTLVAEFIGMEQKEFQAISGSEMQVKLNPPAKALNEDVVEINRMAKNTGNEQTSYISPQPVDGNSNFNRYLVENMKRLRVPPHIEAVAVVTFVVRTSGALDSIKVISSPGGEFAGEAIRLIREGPAWKPAENNGQPIDKEVRVMIDFK